MTTAKKATPAKKAAAKKAAATPSGKTQLDTTPGPEAPAVSDPEVASPDVQKAVEKQAAAVDLGSAAERRSNYLAALDEELDMCQRSGKSDRVEAIKAEIKRVKSAPVGRGEKPSDEA